MGGFWQDVRLGCRILLKNPGFTLIAVLTLALGIGANTAIFSLVNGILLRPLQYPHSEKLLSIEGGFPRAAFNVIRERSRTMDVAAYSDGYEFDLTGQGEPIRLVGALASANLFSVLRVQPELGRAFEPGEDMAGRDDVVILSHALWQGRFGGDPSIVGRSLDIEGAGRRVIGVMPGDFAFPSPQTRVWVPLHIDPRNVEASWGGDYMPLVGRLRDDQTLPQARAEIRGLVPQVLPLFPWPMPQTWVNNIVVSSLQDDLVGPLRARLLLLLGAVAMVLLVACSNIANLLLSRAAFREKEIAIRAVLGARRPRIVRQLLTESVLLSATGGALGLFFAWTGLALLRAILPADTPRLADASIDVRVLLFAAVLAILTGIIFGLAPALRSSREACAESLKSGGRVSGGAASERIRSFLVTGEVAVAVMLVIAAGLLIRSFWNLSHASPGFRADQILTARITPTEPFCRDAVRCTNFYSELLDRFRSLPGVKDAALINDLPLSQSVTKLSVDLEGHATSSGTHAPLFKEDLISPGYFSLMGISLLEGRDFTRADTSGNPPVAIITVSTARKFWPGEDPIGKHLKRDGASEWVTIIGVVTDVREFTLQANAPDWIDGVLYVPYGPRAIVQAGTLPAEMTLALRTSVNEFGLGEQLGKVVANLNSDTPVSDVKTMPSIVSDAVSAPRSTAALFIAFAGVALGLGVIGIYGVLSFFVTHRTHEIGIRMALGAQPAHVLRLVVGEGAKFSLLGVAIGMAAAFLTARVMSGELYGVTPTDPATYFGVAALLAAVSLLACYIPARRAARVDPMVALRYE
jgi:predicted permease